MRLPDPARSRAVLIGTGSYRSRQLPDVPVIANNIRGMRTMLTSARGSGLPSRHVTVVPADADQRTVGRALHQAAREAEDLLLVYYTGHGLLGQRRHDLFLSLADTEPDELGFSAIGFDA